VGKDLLVYNVEFRSHPVEVFSCQLGAAVFHDAGDAFDGLSNFYLKRSVGVGLRALFPQLNRLVMRFDVGVPLVTHGLDPVPPVSFFLSFGQAFPVKS
jgi:outer membrane translocation and assembly module TamA